MLVLCSHLILSIYNVVISLDMFLRKWVKVMPGTVHFCYQFTTFYILYILNEPCNFAEFDLHHFLEIYFITP